MSNYHQQPDDGFSPQAKKLGRVLLIIAILAGLFFSRGYWLPTVLGFFPKQSTAVATNPVNSQPTNVAQPGDTAIPNVQVPAGGRQKLTACIVNFGPYFPVLLIPNDNPAYDLEIVPLNFYTESYEDVVLKNPDYPYINPAGESEQIKMLTDGRCDILLTTTDVQAKHPEMGKLITVIGQSDGADKTVGWTTGVTPGCLGRSLDIFNNVYQADAFGNQVGVCVFAVAQDSVGYFQSLSFLKLANISASQVRIDTYPTPELAVAACVAKKADFCSGWVPAIDNMLDPNVTGGNTKTFISSKSLKTIYDGIFISNNAKQTKSDAILAFDEDWYRAVKMTQDDLPKAAEIIKNWTYQGMPTNEYTFVWDGTQVDDLTAWFSTYAQASFNSQFALLSNPNLMYDIYTSQRDVWAWSGLTLDSGFEPEKMLDLSYTQALSSNTELNSQHPFVDDSFSFLPAKLDPATRENLIQLPTLVEIVCPNVSFQAGKSTIPVGTPEYAALIDCGNQIKSLLNQSNLQILIIGSAAWPDPADYGALYKNCGTKVISTDPFANDYCWSVAVGRASFVQGIFQDKLLIPPQRIALDYQLGPKTPRFDPVTGQALTLQDKRFATIQVKVGEDGLQ